MGRVKKYFFQNLMLLLVSLFATTGLKAQSNSTSPYWHLHTKIWELQQTTSKQKIQVEDIDYMLFLQLIKGASAEQKISREELPGLYFPFKKKKDLENLYLKKAENVTDTSRVFFMGGSRNEKTISSKPLGKFEPIDKKLAKWVWNNPPEPGEYALFIGANATRVYDFSVTE